MEDIVRTKLTPSEVMKRWKIGKTKLYDLMNDGKLSFEKTENGKRKLDISEIVRVLGEPDSEERVTASNHSADIVRTLQSQFSSHESISKDYIESLKNQLAMKDEQLSVKDDQIKSLMSSLEQTTALIGHQPEDVKEESKENEPTPPVKHKSWFNRMFKTEG